MKIETIIEIAHRAGTRILDVYARSGEVQFSAKEDQTPLTEADRLSHEHIVSALRDLPGRYPVVSEEDIPEASEIISQRAERIWLVDPLDGTKEFIKRSGDFTVNIALMERCKSPPDGMTFQPVLGVVFVPAQGITYFASQDSGAWKQSRDGEPQPISCRVPPDRSKLVVVASKDHQGPMIKQMLEENPGYQLTSIGSSLKFCLVAEGSADLYLRDQPTMEWDTAAAQCVVEAAGGSVTELDGAPLRYGKPEFRNPPFIAKGPFI